MKKLILTVTFVLLFTLTACNNTSETDVLESVRETLDIDSEVESIQLPILVDGVSITWESNIDYTLTSGFKTIQGSTDKDIKLTAYLTYEGRMILKEFDITILKSENNVDYSEYYKGVEGLSGDALKTFLYYLIDNHKELSYGELRQALQNTDEDPNNPDNIILLYTGDSIDSSWDYGSSWNREHVWPRSLGDMSEGDAEHNDLHHLRPADPGVNSKRGNKEFDEGGSKVQGTTDCFMDSDSFEPRDEVKGDVARMLFYMAVRYEGDNGEIDLELIDELNGNAPTIGSLSILLQWHLQDPVDDFERNRNSLIFGYQGNRNPFIDYPEFAELIWGSN